MAGHFFTFPWKALEKDFSVSGNQQISLDFAPGLTDQFKTLRQCVSAVVYGARMGLSGVASECDLSPSELSKQLSESEERKLDLDLLTRIVHATKDNRPIYWLIEKHCENAEAKRQRAIETLARVMDDLPALIKQARG